MKTAVVLALLCAFATAPAANAQQTGPDVAVTLTMFETFTVNPARRARLGEEVVFRASIRNHGPGQPADVVVDLDVPGEVVTVTSQIPGTTCTQTRPIRCTHPSPAITSLPGDIHVRTKLTPAGSHRATARVSHSQPDPFPNNDVAAWDVEVVGGPDLRTGLQVTRFVDAYWAEPRIEPGSQDHFTLVASNVAPTAARNVRLAATLPNGGTIERLENASEGVSCGIVGNEVRCFTIGLDSGDTVRVDVHYRSPDRDTGGKVIVRSTIASDDADYDPADNVAEASLTLVRHLWVDHGNDEGPGSLRQAILDAQELCADAPCRIRLGAGYFRPRTPLPELRGFVILEGFNVSVLDGSQQAEGPGIRIGDGCEIQFRGFTVIGFPGHAIEVRGSHPAEKCRGRAQTPNVQIEGNTIGSSAPNLRGIVVDDSDSVAIRYNGIFNSRRAGIFATRTGYLDISFNQIQFNGASGMFLQTTYGADVMQNRISGNGEWGIARSGRGEVGIVRNSIAGNANPAIDHELDFETENHFEDILRLPNKPLLTSAIYDPVTKLTYVNGSIASHPLGGSTFAVELFVNGVNGPHLERSAGILFVAGGTGNFTHTVHEDLTGKFITATLTRTRIIGLESTARPRTHPTLIPSDTSEVSNSVPVNR